MTQPILSILIPTVVGRLAEWNNLLEKIFQQSGVKREIGYYEGYGNGWMNIWRSNNEVEILSLFDKKQLSIGGKREIMYNANITHNLGKMAEEAGIYEALWRPYQLKEGYNIPENLSIIGFADGILASRRLSPSLSTVSQHGPEIGAAAAKLLIERLESKEEENPYKTTI